MNSYPPGCSRGDIDTPEAEAWDAAVDELADVDLDPVLMVQVIKALAPMLRDYCAAEYRAGYQDGSRDGEEASFDKIREAADKLYRMKEGEK
jgi:hypothetical protein